MQSETGRTVNKEESKVTEAMMDLIYVAYNSEKWIEKCFDSVLNCEFDKKKLNIWVVDNRSTDRTVAFLKDAQKRLEPFVNSFTIIESDSNLGFGRANNLAFSKGRSEIACFLNIDTELLKDTFSELEKEISQSESDIGIWEFRQFPYEHPKMYDALTGETTWSSGAAFAIRRRVYEEVNGFDEEIFMYAEDVDLSWRVRSKGYKIKYVPKVRIYHYSYEGANEIKPNQYLFSIIYNLMLRYRYGTLKDVFWGNLRFWDQILRQPSQFEHSKRKLLALYLHSFRKIPHFWSKGIYKKGDVASFLKWDYSVNRTGAFYENGEIHDMPLVSVIVRTCGRPDVLRETLISLRNQTYPNAEIMIVEDGAAISEKMIKEEFPDLNIHYVATGEKVGRSKAGNLGMKLAKGKYLNFLDDDDLFLADHIEVLVRELSQSAERAAYAIGLETATVVHSKSPYSYEIKAACERHKQPFDKITLCHHNYIPIQCIMFEKSLFEQYGGLDETVDALEDWDLWVRYSLHTDFVFVDKTTSIYRVPYDVKINKKRQKELDDALIVMREKHRNYLQTVSVRELADLYSQQ